MPSEKTVSGFLEKRPIDGRKTVYLILGSPFSGASAVADCLILAGNASNGERVVPTTSVEAEVDKINALLAANRQGPTEAGGDAESDALAMKPIDNAVRSIRRLVSRLVRESPLPAAIEGASLWRFLPEWTEILTREGFTPHIVHVFRAPLEAETATGDPERLIARQTLLHWLASNYEILKQSINRPYTLVSYERFLTNPAGALHRLLRSSGAAMLPAGYTPNDALSDQAAPDVESKPPPSTDPEFARFQALWEILAALDPKEPQSVDSGSGNDSGAGEPGASAQVLVANPWTQELIEGLAGLLDFSAATSDPAAGIGDEHARASVRSPYQNLFLRVSIPTENEVADRYLAAPATDEWECLTFPVKHSQALRARPVKVAFASRGATLTLSAAVFVNVATGESVWSADSAHDFASVGLKGSVVRLQDRENLKFLVVGNDGELTLPVFDSPDCPMELRLWVRRSELTFALKEQMGQGDEAQIEQEADRIFSAYAVVHSATSNIWRTQYAFLEKLKEFETVSKKCAPGEFIEATTFWGMPIALLPNEIVSSRIYSYGLFEPELTGFFTQYLGPGAIVFDVGAHIGFYSMLFGTLAGPRGRVFSIEPTPGTLLALRQNTASLPQVLIVPQPAWSEETRIGFQVFGAEFSAFNTAVAARLTPEQMASAASENLEMQTITLDSLASTHGVRPDLVKIDAESAELFVLRGMTGLLEKARPIVTLEVGDVPSGSHNGAPKSRELLQFLKAYAYECIVSVGGRFERREIHEGDYEYDNIVMVPSEQLPLRRPLGSVAVHRGRFF